ncbi:CAF17-like 4Fe-4S cluster assembly/insertion protein YgfZ [Agrococcus sp. Marseille-P2731]|uniref:CAF17-like 4Fe-4S cluster assembly/insertion protein YgfZ n=1 Tax=Agrococcus sp. Marseille-P2731 TaxID=1841862 RepID=UPI000931A139|nr:glycine cleavage T C-terminal barrel domain-containing protein [Agrococcus sp. Marseille-P2731]
MTAPELASRIPDAVLDEASGLPLHVGNPVAEQRRLLAGGLVLLPRDVLRLSGPDTLPWLDSITSQAVEQLDDGASTETLVLSPVGRIEHVLRLLREGDALWVLVDAGTGDALETWLTRMRFYKQVEIERPEVVVVGTAGVAPLAPTWVDGWPEVSPGGARYGEPTGEPWAWSEAILTPDQAAAIAPDRFVGSLAADALRIAAGRPSLAEVDDRTIPHELDWLTTAVHLSKGCYRGQETVAKVHNLGAPPRRIVLLHLDGSENGQVAAGDQVLAGDQAVGQVTSSAVHHELGPIALAVVKRSAPADGDLVVTAADGIAVAAAQQLLVPPSAGHVNRPPRLPRLGAVKRPAPTP